MQQRFSSKPYILKWIEEGEHIQQDFKLRIDDAKKIAKTISAFSNTIGGKLLVGVKDNGQIAGVRQEEEYHMMQWAAERYCKPPVSLQFRAWKVEDKIVLEVYVPEAPKKPVLAEIENQEWKAFLRDHDQNIIAPSVMRDVWLIEENERPEKFFYSSKEQLLLNELQIKDNTLSGLSRATSIKRQVLQRILAKLIRWEIIEWYLVSGVAYFKLRD